MLAGFMQICLRDTEYRSAQHEATPVTTNPMARTPDPERPRTDWQRRLLMSALWPVLWLQGMHVRRVTPRMPALPQPLRWFMGRWARQMNETLAGMLPGQSSRIMHWHPETTTTVGMAMDGIHPSSTGYAVWAEGLSPHILASVAGWASV